METKRWFESKTIWLAILQAVGGILLAVYTEYPGLGYLAMVKSVIDTILRLYTDKPIK